MAADESGLTMTEHAQRADQRAEYPAVRARIRDLVGRLVPSGATIAVVSKGDDELIRFERRRGWHFPRGEGGEFAGHYPSDGPAAVDHLVELEEAGAEYFLLPSTYVWWLDEYPELGEHLRTNCEPVVTEPETCLIYRLGDAPGGTGRLSPRTLEIEIEALLPPLRALADALLPPEETVLVMALGSDSLLDIPRPTRPFPEWANADSFDGRSVGSRAIAEIEDLRDQGAKFLLVPRTSYWWLEQCGDFRDHLAETASVIAVRDQICALFEL